MIVRALLAWLLFSGVASAFDSTEYRTATYGAPDHYCDPALSNTGGGLGTGTLGDPWNLIRCQSEPVAGEVIGVLPGAGTIAGSDSDNIPAFQPANEGTVGNPIVYVTKYAAVALSSVETNGNRTELRHNGVAAEPAQPDTTGTGGAMYGCNNRDYITYDGFYTNVDEAEPLEDSGIIRAELSTGCTFRNFVVKGKLVTLYSNSIVWRSQGTTDTVIANFRLYDYNNNSALGLGQPSAAMMFYGDVNFLVEHFEIDNCGKGIFPKGPYPTSTPYDGNTRFNSGTIRYGIVKNGIEGMRFAAIDSTEYLDVSHVVLYGSSRNGLVYSADIPGFRQHIRLDHLTVVGGASDANQHGVGYVYSDTQTTNGTRTGNSNGNTITNSILDAGGTSSEQLNMEIADANWTEFATNYNYWVRGANPDWYMGSHYTTIANWRTASGGDANSTYYNNAVTDIFRDRAGSDYRVALGHAALTASSTGGEVGAYATSEVIGVDTDGVSIAGNTAGVSGGVRFHGTVRIQ